MPPDISPNFEQGLKNFWADTVEPEIKTLVTKIEPLMKLFNPASGQAAIFDSATLKGFHEFFKNAGVNSVNTGGATTSIAGTTKLDWTSVIPPLQSIAAINIGPNNILQKLESLFTTIWTHQQTGQATIAGNIDMLTLLVSSLGKFNVASKNLNITALSGVIANISTLAGAFNSKLIAQLSQGNAMKGAMQTIYFFASAVKSMAELTDAKITAGIENLVGLLDKLGSADIITKINNFCTKMIDGFDSLEGADTAASRVISNQLSNISEAINLIGGIVTLFSSKMSMMSTMKNLIYFEVFAHDIAHAVGNFFNVLWKEVATSVVNAQASNVSSLQIVTDAIGIIPKLMDISFGKMFKATLTLETLGGFLAQAIGKFFNKLANAVKSPLAHLAGLTEVFSIVEKLPKLILLALVPSVIGGFVGEGLAAFLKGVAEGLEALGKAIMSGPGAIGALVVGGFLILLDTSIMALASSLWLLGKVPFEKINVGLALFGLACIPLSAGLILLSVAMLSASPAMTLFGLSLIPLSIGLVAMSAAIWVFLKATQSLIPVFLDFMNDLKEVIVSMANAAKAVFENTTSILDRIITLVSLGAMKIGATAVALSALAVSITAIGVAGAAGTAGGIFDSLSNFFTGKTSMTDQISSLSKLASPLSQVANSLESMANSLTRIQNADISRTTKQLQNLSNSNLHSDISASRAGMAIPAMIATNVNMGGNNSGGGQILQGSLPPRIDVETNLNEILDALRIRNL